MKEDKICFAKDRDKEYIKLTVTIPFAIYSSYKVTGYKKESYKYAFKKSAKVHTLWAVNTLLRKAQKYIAFQRQYNHEVACN